LAKDGGESRGKKGGSKKLSQKDSNMGPKPAEAVNGERAFIPERKCRKRIAEKVNKSK